MLFGRTFPSLFRPAWPYSINFDSPQAQGLVFWWPGRLNDTPTRCLDLINGDGTVTGSPTFSIDPIFGPNYTHTGTSLQSFPDQARYNLTFPFAISCWINTTSSSNTVIVEKNGNNGFSLQKAAGAGLLLNVGNSAPGISQTVNDGLWHHIFVEAPSNSVVPNWWIDGVETTAGSTTPASPSYGSSTPLFIGSRNGASGMVGNYFDVRLYQGAWANPVDVYSQNTRWDLYKPGIVRIQTRHKSSGGSTFKPWFASRNNIAISGSPQ